MAQQFLQVDIQEDGKQAPTQNLYTVAHSSIIHNGWKEPKCPSADEWANKMWHIHTMEYYSAAE